MNKELQGGPEKELGNLATGGTIEIRGCDKGLEASTGSFGNFKKTAFG